MTTITEEISSMGNIPSTNDPTNFDTYGDEFLGTALPNLRNELNTFAGQVNTVAAEMDAVAATVLAVSATTKWVSGTTYAEGAGVWSPINYAAYRRKVAGAGATDPSLDATNWARVSYPLRTKKTTETRAIDAATGSVAYTGVGFRPSKVTVFAIIAGTGCWSQGVGDGTNTMCIAFHQTAPSVNGISAYIAVAKTLADSTKGQFGSLVSLDADGCTIQWDNGGSPPAGTAVSLSFFWEG